MHHHTEGSEELAARSHELQRELDRYQLKCDELNEGSNTHSPPCKRRGGEFLRG